MSVERGEVNEVTGKITCLEKHLGGLFYLYISGSLSGVRITQDISTSVWVGNKCAFEDWI